MMQRSELSDLWSRLVLCQKACRNLGLFYKKCPKSSNYAFLAFIAVITSREKNLLDWWSFFFVKQQGSRALRESPVL